MVDCFLLFRPGVNRVTWRERTVEDSTHGFQEVKRVKDKEWPPEKIPIENALPVTSLR